MRFSLCVALFGGVFSYGVGAMLSEFVGKIAPWEDDYRKKVVSAYSPEKLKNSLVSLKLVSSGSVPIHIDQALVEVISVPVGKSVVQSIVASLEPRVDFVNSVYAIIKNIKTISDGEIALRTVYALFRAIEPTALNSMGDVKNHIDNMLTVWQYALNDNPRKIVLTQYNGQLWTSNPLLLSQRLIDKLDVVFSVISEDVRKYQFDFGIGKDCYSITDRVIYISDRAPPTASVITGPELVTYGVTVGYACQYENFEVDERLLHELLHYYHITLRKEPWGDFWSVGLALVQIGFDPSYTGVLANLWTNPEELKTISGLTMVSEKVLGYCKESESRYLSEKGKCVRFSHSLAYCTKVPKYFFDLLKRTGITPNLKSSEKVDYVKQLDDLI